jgi:hypothetical protein
MKKVERPQAGGLCHFPYFFKHVLYWWLDKLTMENKLPYATLMG